jgi:hypothetical protein
VYRSGRRRNVVVIKGTSKNSQNTVSHRKGAKNAKVFPDKNLMFFFAPLRLCGEHQLLEVP